VPGLKTNERPGTRASLRHCRMSAYKAREVLNLIRGQEYSRAVEILQFSDREAAAVVGKLLHSAGANAFHNDGIDAEETFVSACYADEGTTMKRWKPRARGRASRIRKRTCHITLILTRMPEDEIARRRAKVAAEQAERRARRVAGGRRRRAAEGAEVGKDESAGATTDNAEALEALEEARTLESESHRAELESEAEGALEHDHGDEDGDEDGDEGADHEGRDDVDSSADESGSSDLSSEQSSPAANDEPSEDVAEEAVSTVAQAAVSPPESTDDDASADSAPQEGEEN
jgi:large subunit ribosomal protein L22